MKNTGIHTGYVYQTDRLKRIIFLFCCVLFTIQLFGQKSLSGEYNLKSAFLFNFTHFIEWPQNAFTGVDGPFIIGVLGDDPFGNSLDLTVAGEKVKGHPIIVQRYLQEKDIRACNILFISYSETDHVKEMLSGFHTRNILTVSDIPDFANVGGIIRFNMKDNKIKLQVNLSAAKAANLNISSKLLRLAEIVETSR